MSLASRLAVSPTARPGRQVCTVGRLLTDLVVQAGGYTDDPTSDYVALVTALADPAWSSAAIERAVFDEGHGELSDRHVRAHRAGRHTETTCLVPKIGVIS